MSADEEIREDVGVWSIAVYRSLVEIGEAIETLTAGLAALRQEGDAGAEDERDRSIRLGDEVGWLQEKFDAAQGDSADARRAMANLDSDARRLAERGESLEAAAVERAASVRTLAMALQFVRGLERRLVAAHDRRVAVACWRESSR